MAIQLNTSQSTISFYETEDRLPDMKICTRIAEFFHVSLDYLAGRSEVRNPGVTENLTELETNILSQLKSLNKDDQKQVEGFIKGLLTKS